MVIFKCKDCYKEHHVDTSLKLVICGCGGLVFDRDDITITQIELSEAFRGGNLWSSEYFEIQKEIETLSCLTFIRCPEVWKDSQIPEELIL